MAEDVQLLSSAGGEAGPGEEARRGSSSALKGFLGIVTGSAVAQVLAVAAIPVLARLYDPAETAHYAVLLGVGAVCASFASLRLDYAIPLPKNLAESRGLFWLAVLVSLAASIGAGLIAALMSAAGIWRFEELDLVDIACVAGFVVVLCSFSAASQLGVRGRAYGLLGRIPVIQMLGTLTAQVALGFVGFGRGLFVGGAAGRSLGIVGLARSSGLSRTQIPAIREAKWLLRKYWRFPAIFAPAAAVNVLGSNLAVLLLPLLFGLTPAGFYAMALRVSAVPATIVGQSAGQVFLGEFARASNRAQSMRVFLRWSAALLAMGLAVSVAIWVFSPLVLPPLLGAEWDGTAQLAQWAGVMAGAGIVGSPVQHVWTVRQRGLTQFAWNVLRLVATAGTLWMGSNCGKAIVDVAADLAVATVLVYAVAWLGCLWVAGQPSRGDGSWDAAGGGPGTADGSP